MSCHDLGWSPHNKEDLAKALAKLPIVCKDCGSDEFADTHDARIVGNIIYYRSLCVRCDTAKGRAITFYNPKDNAA